MSSGNSARILHDTHLAAHLSGTVQSLQRFFQMLRFLPMIALALLVAQPLRADQWDALRADPVISDGLIRFAIARHIHNRCDDISARRLRAITYISSLVSLAEDRGYSRSEIRAYVDDEAEQDRVRALADERLAARGASPEQMGGYCTVGREEIAAGSEIGRLLR